MPKLKPHTLNLSWNNGKEVNTAVNGRVHLSCAHPLNPSWLQHLYSVKLSSGIHRTIFGHLILLWERLLKIEHMSWKFAQNPWSTLSGAKQYVAPLPCTISFVMDKRTGEKGQASSANKQSRLYTQFL